ncbi:HlyC/CorC family transporter [Pelagibius sp.]|uniref:HlyC/CorC family transporter n=1 Tax=Pelagibius sp. TaxID=1931238 RepID=UPI00262E00A0|nr:HlyC/CorC family transporter [Pelagibius sp.]
MDMDIAITLGAILVLLAISAFFSGSETALTAASRPRMHNLAQSGNRRAYLVDELWLEKEHLIGAILLGNNLVNILASALATSVLIALFGEAGVVYATLGMTLMVLIFAEVLPKTYALQNADRAALNVAPILSVIVTILKPISVAIQVIVRSALSFFGIEVRHTLTSEAIEEQLRGAIDLHQGEGEGEEEKHEREMLRSILDLGDVWVEEIMVHRKEMVSIDIDQPPARIVEEVLSSPYTRLPLWRDDPDNIVGVLHAKALLRAVQAADNKLDGLDIVAIANAAWFIPETTDLLSQLQAFRSRHEHFAIVVDEYGEVLGIVTLEDILEEIVGDISDEHDIEMEGVQMERAGSFIVEGKVTLRDLNRRFEWRLPDEEASTIAGLVLHEARRIPEIGQVFTFHGLNFEILGRKRNQVTSIRITQPPEAGVPEAGVPEAGVQKTEAPEAEPSRAPARPDGTA